MKRISLQHAFVLILVSLAAYLFLDLPVRVTGVLAGGVIGIKSFLPSALGLVFGWCGVLGCVLGALLASLMTSAPVSDLAVECGIVLISGLSMWLLWHLGAADRRVHLKQGRDYLRYILLSALAAAGCGLLGLAVPSAGSFTDVFTAVFVLNLMVGIPVIILLTSTVCTLPVRPFWSHQEPDLAGRIEPDPASLEAFNEQLEDYSQAQGISRKTIFGIQNCVEEVMMRIGTEAGVPVDVRLYYDDSFSLWLEYGGSRRNPFSAEKGEQAEDLLGLQLIKQRALRASHYYQKGVNHVHIVI
jgi:hypothetical protein